MKQFSFNCITLWRLNSDMQGVKGEHTKDCTTFENLWDKPLRKYHVPGGSFCSDYCWTSYGINVISRIHLFSFVSVFRLSKFTTLVLSNIIIFDSYMDDKISTDKKSIALGLIFQSKSRTLNDDEIDEYMLKINRLILKEMNLIIR